MLYSRQSKQSLYRAFADSFAGECIKQHLSLVLQALGGKNETELHLPDPSSF